MMQRWNEWRDGSPLALRFFWGALYFGVYLLTINLAFTPGYLTGEHVLITAGEGVLFGLFLTAMEARPRRRRNRALGVAANRSIRGRKLSSDADRDSLLTVLRLRLAFYKRGVWLGLGLYGVLSVLCLVMVFVQAIPVVWLCLLAFFVVMGTGQVWLSLNRAASTRALLEEADCFSS